MADILEKIINFSGTAVTITTTTERVIISSGAIILPFNTAQIIIRAWAQLTTGTATTTVTPRIRRGTAVTGTLVGEENAENVKAAAGSTEPFFIIAAEGRSNERSVEYSLTLEQASATGDGSVLFAAIEVEVLTG